MIDRVVKAHGPTDRDAAYRVVVSAWGLSGLDPRIHSIVKRAQTTIGEFEFHIRKPSAPSACSTRSLARKPHVRPTTSYTTASRWARRPRQGDHSPVGHRSHGYEGGGDRRDGLFLHEALPSSCAGCSISFSGAISFHTEIRVKNEKHVHYSRISPFLMPPSI